MPDEQSGQDKGKLVSAYDPWSTMEVPSPGQDEQITREVWAWVEQVRYLLQLVNDAIEKMELRQPATSTDRQLVKKLPGLIRQRLAGTPTPEMIQTWIRVLSRPLPPSSQPRAKHK